MVGREITEIYPESKSKIGEVILKVKHASRKGEFKKIDFELRKGEKLGIAGLMGAGRTELMMAVFGAAKLEEGEIEIGGVPVRIQSPKDAIRQKIALVTEDRKRYGLNLTASVEDNAVSVIESSLSKFGFYRRKLGRKVCGGNDQPYEHKSYGNGSDCRKSFGWEYAKSCSFKMAFK